MRAGVIDSASTPCESDVIDDMQVILASSHYLSTSLAQQAERAEAQCMQRCVEHGPTLRLHKDLARHARYGRSERKSTG